MLGADHRWLVRGEDWVTPIRAAVADGEDTAMRLALELRHATAEAWSQWADQSARESV
jgi:hypothetical protein